jgi:hypothetical protein
VRRGIDLVQDAAYKGINLTEGLIIAEQDIKEELEPTQQVKDENGEICGLDSEISTQIRTAYDEFVVQVNVSCF